MMMTSGSLKSRSSSSKLSMTMMPAEISPSFQFQGRGSLRKWLAIMAEISERDVMASVGQVKAVKDDARRGLVLADSVSGVIKARRLAVGQASKMASNLTGCQNGSAVGRGAKLAGSRVVKTDPLLTGLLEFKRARRDEIGK